MAIRIIRDQILSSKNYDNFVAVQGQRPWSPVRHDKVKKLILAHDRTAEFPIVVFPVTDRNGVEKLGIYYGQHRFSVCKELGLPIRYIFLTEPPTTQELGNEESHNTAWKAHDFFGAFISEGNQNYVKLKSMLQRYKMWMESGREDDPTLNMEAVGIYILLTYHFSQPKKERELLLSPMSFRRLVTSGEYKFDREYDSEIAELIAKLYHLTYSKTVKNQTKRKGSGASRVMSALRTFFVELDSNDLDIKKWGGHLLRKLELASDRHCAQVNDLLRFMEEQFNKNQIKGAPRVRMPLK